MAVWMDVVEERQLAPTWKGGIVAKVSRISMEDDDDDDDDFDDAFPAPTPPPQTQAPVPRAPPSHGSAASAGSIDDLFGTAPAPAPPASSGGGSLLDFNDHHAPAPQPAATPAAHTDFFGMTAHPPAQTTTGVQSAPSSGGYRGNPNMYAQQQQMHMQQQQQQQQRPSVPPPQQQQFNTFSGGQQGQQGAFGGLGTPWK
jgi:hypothetical protein